MSKGALDSYKGVNKRTTMTEIDLPADKTLLLVDDDKPFLTRLARAMVLGAPSRHKASGARPATQDRQLREPAAGLAGGPS